MGFLLRLAPLGRYVTPDEPTWIYRAIYFADALAARDWAAIPLTNHPGVTTMWLGTLGIAIRRLFNPAESALHLEWIRRLAWLPPDNGEAFGRLAFFLPWSRVAVALVATLGLAALYPLVTRLFGRQTALLTVGLLAFDPFLVGHSGLLHTDALLATFSLLALVAALNGQREPRRISWWALSGFFAGLALLTKTPALLLFPFILCLCIVAAPLRRSPLTTRLLHTLPHCLLFILAALVTCFALYPALWAKPFDILHTLSTGAKRHIETTQRPIFFAGQMTYDPGLAFYPAVFLFRISPLVLAGLVAGLATLRRLPSDRRVSFLLLLAFAVIFSTLMSLGIKKHDRYLLPPFLSLTLAAALGIGAWVDWYTGRPIKSTNRRPTNLPILLLPIILTLQALIAVAFLFYPLTYATPLAGGPWVAARVLPLDWGEGMGGAARWLNQLPHANRLTVATSAIPTFAPLFEGHTVLLDHATLSDYIVTTPSDLPVYRPANPPIYQSTSLPTHQSTNIYTNTAPFEQAAYLAARAAPADLILLDADTPLQRHYTGPGTLTAVTNLPDQAAVANHLTELSAGRSRIWLVADPAASPITAAHLRQAIEAIATPVSTATLAHATVTQYTIHNTPHVSFFTHRATFNEQIALIDAVMPTAPTHTSFPVFLRWKAAAPTPTNLYASLYLQDAAGHLWAKAEQPILNKTTFPTSAWTPGEWADDSMTLNLPKHTPPGTYTIRLTVTDDRNAQLGAWDAAGRFQGVRISLGEVEIAPSTKPVGPVSCAEGRSMTAAPFLACVPELPPQAIPSGDTLTLSITWSATASPQADYSIRWRLRDTAGSAALEQVVALSAYPTSHWRSGDTFKAYYDLRLEPTLPAATYTLGFNVLAPGGRALWADDETLATVEVLPRDRLFELPANIAHPLDLTLGDIVHLRGFDLDQSQAAPGGILPLTLYWQEDGPTDVNYTVFVHLVGPDGQLHGQVDQFPAAGAAPTTSWAPDQVVVDAVTLPIAADAPAGAYHIAIGMYDAVSGGRLPIADPSGQLLADDRLILPIEITIAGGSP